MPFPSHYRYERLTSAQSAAIRSARDNGVPAVDLAREYGVSVRTIYRILIRESQPRVRIQIGDWTAPFAITDEGPVQVDQWRPAEPATDAADAAA